MSELFKVGDLVELCNLEGDCEDLNGAEASIVDGPDWFEWASTGMPVYGYLIDCAEERQFFVFADEVRKRRPPRTNSGERMIREMFDKSPVVQPELEPA